MEVVAQRCCLKKVFLKISQNLRKNTCARVLKLVFVNIFNKIYLSGQS